MGLVVQGLGVWAGRGFEVQGSWGFYAIVWLFRGFVAQGLGLSSFLGVSGIGLGEILKSFASCDFPKVQSAETTRYRPTNHLNAVRKPSEL